MTAVAFWKNGNFTECVLWESSSAWIDTKSRGIKATCIVSGDKNDPMYVCTVGNENLGDGQGMVFVYAFNTAFHSGAKPHAHSGV